MLKYFFEKTETDNSYLFHKTNIWQEEDFKKFCGQYPVIFLSFKDVKQATWSDAYENLTQIISHEFSRHSKIIDMSAPTYEIREYRDIVEKKSSKVAYSNSLLLLSQVLNNHYKQNTIILIDEYDSPIHTAYEHGYYNEMIHFMRTLLSTSLKDNITLHKGVLTGIFTNCQRKHFL